MDTVSRQIQSVDRRRYLERLVSDEGEEGDGSVHVPPGSGHTGSAQHLPVPESNAELQSHVGRRLPGRSTTTSQGHVEPDGGTHTNQTSEFSSKTTEYKYSDGSEVVRRCYLSGRGSTTPTTTTFFPGCIPPVMGPLNGTACTHTHTHTHTHLHKDVHIVMNDSGSNWRRTDKIKDTGELKTRTWRLDVTRVLSASLSAERTLALFPSVKLFCGKTHF